MNNISREKLFIWIRDNAAMVELVASHGKEKTLDVGFDFVEINDLQEAIKSGELDAEESQIDSQ